MKRDAHFPALVWMVGIISVVPFWLCAYAVYRPLEEFSPITALALAPIYGGVYLGLLGGTKWGVVSAAPNVARPALQMLAALLFVVAGFLAVVLPAAIGLSLIIIFVIAAALWDLVQGLSGRTAFWYTRLRVWVTILTVSPLVALLVKVL